ncbi:arsenate reductase (glutaredoxin) [Methylocapsa aurea]|uniref:arsenate reductase (glutaredoxin) n=1 Tax=Methylocapsa aurea TaxID=663610 RepID=UPI00068CCB51|nr:arsenate reductase (glutaredoxin) [Methylocapsa aurea]
MSLTIYHNPSCATSRKVLGLIRQAGIEPLIVPYLKEPPSKAVLLDLLARMKLKPRAILRRRGTPYDDLGLADEGLSDAVLIDAMLKYPILIERPIVSTESLAMLCRPPERVYELLPAGPQKEQVKAGQAKPVKSDRKG